MGRPAYGARSTCESCKSIDVRRWHREGRLSAGQDFTCSWSRFGSDAGSIKVSAGRDAIMLTYRTSPTWSNEWRSINQRVPITWTACHFGGRRPWFVCSVSSEGRFCGRRVAVLYGPGELFACRHCYGLIYASQQVPARERGYLKARKIRMLLGGDANVLEACPEKPPRMHCRTYERLYRAYEDARGRCIQGVLGRVPRVERDLR
jgi:hypothetical protein